MRYFPIMSLSETNRGTCKTASQVFETLQSIHQRDRRYMANTWLYDLITVTMTLNQVSNVFIGLKLWHMFIIFTVTGKNEKQVSEGWWCTLDSDKLRLISQFVVRQFLICEFWGFPHFFLGKRHWEENMQRHHSSVYTLMTLSDFRTSPSPSVFNDSHWHKIKTVRGSLTSWEHGVWHCWRMKGFCRTTLLLWYIFSSKKYFN